MIIRKLIETKLTMIMSCHTTESQSSEFPNLINSNVVPNVPLNAFAPTKN